MAESPAHRFGQIIGEVLEAAIGPVIRDVAESLGLYLDSHGPRATRDGRAKVTWQDGEGNDHDLDYVVEDGGSEDVTGEPRAFIEVAWRRYTKHSRNKVQEIQGAIVPLARRYERARPFLGAVLAGVFTENSLQQLRSHGFHVLYFPYDSVVHAFAKQNIDAAFDEETSDREFQRKVKAFQRLSAARRRDLAAGLRRVCSNELAVFVGDLRRWLTRRIEAVVVIPLHGAAAELKDAARAIQFVKAFDESTPYGKFVRYEIQVRYSGGDELRGQFTGKAAAIEFLRNVR